MNISSLRKLLDFEISQERLNIPLLSRTLWKQEPESQLELHYMILQTNQEERQAIEKLITLYKKKNGNDSQMF